VKKLTIHKVTNPKTIKLLESLNDKKSYRKASQLVQEVYMDTGCKITGKHLVVGVKENGKCTKMYIIENVDNPEILKDHWDELPDDLRDQFAKDGGQFDEEIDVVRYESKEEAKAEANEEFSVKANDCVMMLGKYFREKRIHPTDAVGVILAAYNMITALSAKDIDSKDRLEFLITQKSLIDQTSEMVDRAIKGLKK